MLRRNHILATAAVLAVCASPASAATYEQLRSGDSPPPPSSIASGTNGGYQDLRSPDAVDAAAQRGIYAPETTPGPYALNRDYGSPDAADAARDLPPVQVPVVVADSNPSGGFDWGDAGIGAAGIVGLFGIAGGCALMLSGRRRRHRLA